jgi:hypothetical protein
MTPQHTCHWTGCTREVPPAMWGCKEHWFKLPKPLRDAVWANYRPGQEITKTPSLRYLATLKLVLDWIAGKIDIGGNGSVIPVPEAQWKARS